MSMADRNSIGMERARRGIASIRTMDRDAGFPSKPSRLALIIASAACFAFAPATGFAAGTESNAVDEKATKYYSVKDAEQLVKGSNFEAYTNANNDGAKKYGALAAGFETYADGIAATVTGSMSGVINQASTNDLDFRGAASASYGTFNLNQNSDQSGTYSGAANTIVGQANLTQDSNAALIYGAGNVVKNSYRDVAFDKIQASSSDPEKLIEALQAAVPESGGQRSWPWAAATPSKTPT